MLLVNIKKFATEDEVIIACEELTREGILSSYGKVGQSFQLKVRAQERETAINLIANSYTMRSYGFFKQKDSEDS